MTDIQILVNYTNYSTTVTGCSPLNYKDCKSTPTASPFLLVGEVRGL